jgi:O-antigen ligase
VRQLLVAFVMLVFVEYWRPQDILTPLAALKPGLITLGVVVIFLLRTFDKVDLEDAILRAAFAFLAVVTLGIFVAVNQRFWYWSLQAVATSVAVWMLAAPILLRTQQTRRSVLRLMLLTFMFLAMWALTHNGLGPGSFLTDENDLGLALVIGVAFAWGASINESSRAWRCIAVAGLGLMVAGVIVTGSRGAFVGLVGTVMGIVCLSPRVFRTLMVLSLVIAMSIPLVPAEYLGEVQSIGDQQDSTRKERLYSWNRGLEMYVANPVIGVGAGNFPWRVGEFEQSPKALAEREGLFSIAGRVVHSLYFQLLPETGTLGGIAYFSALFLALIRARRYLRSGDCDADDSYKQLAMSVGAGLVGFSLGAAFISVLFYPHFWMLVGFAIAIPRGGDISVVGSRKPPGESTAGVQGHRHSPRAPSTYRGARRPGDR